MKVSAPWPNVANAVRDYLKATWPELVRIPYLWFTGSTVWHFLYDIPQREGADLDVFVTRHRLSWEDASAAERAAVASALNRDLPWNPDPLKKLREALFKLNAVPMERMRPQLQLNEIEAQRIDDNYQKGERVMTSRGQVDYWAITCEPWQQLDRYPYDSHAHCHAAYSFYGNTLLVRPNGKATAEGEYELMERTSFERLRRAEELQTKARGA